jgi:hypothetical protein
MLKRIPKSDISIRPFKAYKEWSFDETSNEINLLEANETSSVLSGLYPQNSIYGQLRAQFYYDSGDNIFLRSGHKQSIYTNSKLAKERFLSGSAKVISIPNIYVGEGIKKGSVVLVDNENQLNEISYVDDSFGNLQDNRDQINISRIDMGEEFPGTQPAIINFIDLDENVYSASLELYAFDIQSETLDIIYNGIPRPTITIESGIAIAEDIPFLPEQAQGIKIGNVFYNQGLIVITKDAASRLENGWQLDYKSTKTIYEHEYLLIANEDEFNVSQNPSAVVEVGKVTEFITGSDNKIYKVTTNPGTKYIKKKSVLETGEILDYRFASNYTSSVSGGFEHYDLSGSIDSTGSFLAPFITTIGLYDDNCDLVAVAKLPQPIKSEPDMPVNFIIRFDT